MGSRDHACPTCNRGGTNDERPCVCFEGTITAAEALRIAEQNACRDASQPDELHLLARWVVEVLGAKADHTGSTFVEWSTERPTPNDRRSLAAALLRDADADEADAKERT